MREIRRTFPVFFLAICVALASTLHSQATGDTQRHVFFRVGAAASLPGPVSGRLLVFMKQGAGDKEVSISEFRPTETSVASMEVHDLNPGASLEFDADRLAFPKPFSELAAGNYEVQAVLDVNHSYNYSGRNSADWISSVVPLANWTPGAGSEPSLVLDQHAAENPMRAGMVAKSKEQAKEIGAHLEQFESPLLSRFWGHPVQISAWVIVPPGYESGKEKYPTAYWTAGFGGAIDSSLVTGTFLYQRMKDKRMPPMIWVMLDESCPQGTHEFADSVNNGPWGAALTTEFIPYLESKYRMDARPTGRLLNGHSSGGWATLQLQVNYPRVFGGTWSTSPDPSDFHDFTGSDLYAANANVYRGPNGKETPIMRDKGQVMATFKQFSQLETVLGPYGGQVASFDWVFSPKGASGAPVPMFDHVTGAVDPSVVAYWHDHYDLAHITEATWAQRGADLKGRIHLIVGTADTFYLDGAAHKYEAVLNKLGAEPHFTYLEGRTHFDLYVVGKDRMALFDQIAGEMYQVARPNSHWKGMPPEAQ